jgi:hypothetical protein
LQPKKRQKDGVRNIKTGDFSDSIFLTLVLFLGEAGGGRGMRGRGMVGNEFQLLVAP